MDPEFLLSKKMAGKGDKELDRKARREQRRKHIAEINRVKLEKEQERFLVRNALETTMGLGLKDIFSTLQKMGGKAMTKMFDRVFIEVSLGLIDKMAMGQELGLGGGIGGDDEEEGEFDELKEFRESRKVNLM